VVVRDRPAPAVHALRTRPAFDVELEWWFNRAESDMGVQSTFEQSIVPRRQRRDDPIPEAATHAATAYRQIRGWLLAIPDRDAGVLQAAYESRPWPPRLYDDLGRLTGVVVRLACALDAWPEDRRMQQALEQARAELLAHDFARYRGLAFGPVVRLRRRAEKRFVRAHHAYALVRGPGPCLVSAS
jgi:hypothetical protein